MQRQSLGSPSSKLYIHGGEAAKDEILMAEKDHIQSLNDEEDDPKCLKPLRSSSSPQDKLIHLIPLLMFFCFLLLYLSSHDPSRSELAQFHGLIQRSTKLTDLEEIADMERFVVKSDVISIGSLRNLQEIGEEFFHIPERRETCGGGCSMLTCSVIRVEDREKCLTCAARLMSRERLWIPAGSFDRYCTLSCGWLASWKVV